MLTEEVTEADVAEVVAKWTGIPVTRLLEGEVQKLIQMEERLHERVIGQDEAIEAVSNALRRSRAGLSDPDRPIGSFLFLGPTGVGKTELAKALAEFMFDSEQAIVRLDMSEYMEKHTVARLIGAPPGYVGYEEGGQLTEAVRRRPYAVVLLDEIEKAHPDVFNTLLQIMDDGRLTDGQGRTVSFTNTVLIMTSNVGSDRIVGEQVDERIREQIEEVLAATFKPEFLNRIDDTVIFHRLSKEDIGRIVELQVSQLVGRVAERGIAIELSGDARTLLGNLGYDPTFGARPLKRVIQKQLVDRLALKILVQRRWRRADEVSNIYSPRRRCPGPSRRRASFFAPTSSPTAPPWKRRSPRCDRRRSPRPTPRTAQALEKFGRDLTADAESGKLDPVIGRDEEIRRVIQVLSRRTKNNPVLIGEPGRRQDRDRRGAGAADRRRRRAREPARPARDRARHRLAAGRLQIPGRVRGAAESGALNEVQEAEGQIVLFLDELHTIVGAGAAEGAVDAANLLKPMLARGELRAVGATTLDEYRKHIEKDAALERRFQPVLVGEPDINDTIAILRGLKGRYESHHGVRDRRLRDRRRRDPLGALHRRPLPARQGDRPDRRGGLAAEDRDRLDADRDRRGRAPRSSSWRSSARR